MRSRCDGFTVLEVLVAIIVLMLGVVGWITTAAAVPQLVSQGRSSNEVAAVALRELERLHRAACRGAGQGEWSSGGQTVSWEVTRVEAMVYHLKVQVRTKDGWGEQANTFTTVTVC